MFLQSSPFVNNNYLAKDSRLLLYRGGRKLKYNDGLYSKHQFFGALSPYKQTLRDLISSIKRRHKKWRKLMRDNNFNPDKQTPPNVFLNKLQHRIQSYYILLNNQDNNIRNLWKE